MVRSFFSASRNALSILAILLVSIHSQVDAADALSFHIDYKESSSELCWIGAHYDTDKSSQRKNVPASGHCHPYTLFYDSVFKDKRDQDLVIAELGILYGSSLLMWEDYFSNATIYGFEYSLDLIDAFKKTYNHDRINLAQLNVQDPSSITQAFHSTGTQYDLIIDDTTHEFEDQLRII